MAEVIGTILLVDDEPDLLALVSWRLEREGPFKVLQASGGPAGLQMAKTNHPDAVVLDYMMPVMNGPEVLRRLKEDAGTRDIPVLMLSVMGSEEKVAESIRLGAVCHLTKENTSDLLRELKLAVAKHREAHKGAR